MTNIVINRIKYNHLNALFFGLTQDPISTNFQRLGCLRQLGVNVQAHNAGIISTRPSVYQRVRRKLTHTAFSADEIRSYNEAVLKACIGAAPDFVWFESPILMEAETLARIREQWPGTLLICFQDDNPFGDLVAERPRWRLFIPIIPLYDIHFIKRTSDLAEFSKRGARRLLFFQHGVYEPLFHPDDRPTAQRGSPIPVSFVGTARDHRVGIIAELISRHRIPLQVYGARWNRTWVGLRHKSHFFRTISSDDYTRVIWESRISLAFVSSLNHDEYNGRTFEIPGSAGFFLAERTPKHQELYEEGKEAEFFSSAEECADKIKFYLNNEEARQRIARAGYERCIRSDYRLVSRMREALDQLFP
jgi:spore maturation protein CgeB